MSKRPQARPAAIPEVIIPAIRVPQSDGSVLFKAGKPVVVEAQIGTAEAARIMGMSRRWVIAECESGNFKTAHRPGLKASAWWKISRAEVLARLKNLPE